MTEEELKQVYIVYRDFWTLLRTHSQIPGNEPAGAADRYWEKLVTDCSELIKKHGGTEFAGNLGYAVLGVLAEYERKRRKPYEKEHSQENKGRQSC